MSLKALCTLLIAVALSLLAETGTANAWGCSLFDGMRDIECLPHPDYVMKRVNFFCGDNRRYQFSPAGGNCQRDGVAFDLREFNYHGVPAIRWNLEGRKSRAVLATGCFCIIDE